MMFLRWYRLINILSLDVVAGAVINALYFAKVFQVMIRPYALIALALSVWIIYTADHLWDAKKIGKHAASRRHRFHQKYFKVLSMLLMICIVLNAVMIFFIRPAVFFAGIILLFFIAAYHLVQRKLHYAKEIFVACLYATGILLPSVTVTPPERITAFHIVLIVAFFFVCLLNLFIFSWFDAERDVSDRLGSFVTRFGKERTARIIRGLFLAAVSAAVASFFVGPESIAAIFPLAMSLVLMIIFSFPQYFEHRENYRLLGDAVFVLPLIYLLCAC